MNVSAFLNGAIFRCVSILPVLFLSHFVSANANDFGADDYKLLAEQNAWRSLLHYEITDQRDDDSQVDDANFFLSSQGHIDPYAELLQTIDAFYHPFVNVNDHAICKFPARYEWLKGQGLLKDITVELQQCPDFSKWLGDINPDKTVLVFASAYLNSPSSMFGHTFLRIDPPDVEQGSKWLSHAINFGAEFTGGDNSIAYAYKGLLGGYPGFFSVIPYFEKVKEYNEIENRDIWEYELNLSAEETRRLVVHLWELKDVNFDYYFFDENCSYRLLELLEVARSGLSLREGFDVKAIPIDTVRSVIDADLVSKDVYRASAATKIDALRHELNPEEQKLAWRIAHRETDLQDPSLINLNHQKRSDVLRFAYRHLRFVQRKTVREKSVAQHSLNILKELKKNPAPEHDIKRPLLRPDEGHDSMLAGVKVGHEDSDNNNYLELRLRASYHDLLDPVKGYLQGAAINIGEVVLKKPESGSVQLELLNLIDISSHSPQSLFAKPITWRIKAGFERLNNENDSYLTTRIEGGAGITLPISENHSAYGLFMVRPEYNELLGSNLSLGFGGLVGALFHTAHGTLQLESSYFVVDHEDRVSHQFSWGIPIKTNNAIRLKAKYTDAFSNNDKEFSVEYRRHF